MLCPEKLKEARLHVFLVARLAFTSGGLCQVVYERPGMYALALSLAIFVSFQEETLVSSCALAVGPQVVAIATTPTQFKIPSWFLNRQKDVKDGKSKHVAANGLDTVWREDLERLKKMRLHRGLRHYWSLKVRGQHTKTTGRHGRTVGVAKKKGC